MCLGGSPGRKGATTMHVNPRKAAIIGCGFVGSAIAFRFLQQGLFSQLVLLDVDYAKAEGEAMDISDGTGWAWKRNSES